MSTPKVSVFVRWMIWPSSLANAKVMMAALGNQVSQLHVHLIARYKSDAAWPKPIWGGPAEAYSEAESRKFIYELKSALDSLQLT
jgi:diadenosine tetraphosphate (Ap4A) HIT family hydrolase